MNFKLNCNLNLMCFICNTNINELYQKTEIKGGGCPNLKSIPYLPNLRELDIENFPNLETIACLPNLQELTITRCPKLKTLERLPNLRRFFFGNNMIEVIANFPKLTGVYGSSNKLKEIRDLPMLRECECEDCDSLIAISNCPSLYYIRCSGSELIEKITELPLLETLICESCPKLFSVSNLPKLTFIECVECPMLVITNLPLLEDINCQHCNWVYYSPRFRRNITLLKKLHQKLLWRKIGKYMNSTRFNEWCYSPNGPGGKIAIKRLEEMKNEK